jgi:hypothetical protein
MSWLVLGIGIGALMLYFDDVWTIMERRMRSIDGSLGLSERHLGCFVYGVAAIGGMVIVG